MKLTPKPTERNPLYDWEFLDRMLQRYMKESSKSKEPSFTIDPDEFEMSSAEIIAAGKEAGYNVETLPSSGYLQFS